MATTTRTIAFDARLLEELEQRSGRGGEGLSRLVNEAVDRFLHPDGRALRLVPEPADLAGGAAAYRDALLIRDARGARAVVEDAVRRGTDIIDIHAAILAPAMHEIGHLWALDEVSVAEEHFATEVTMQVLGSLAPDRRVTPTEGRLALVSGSPDEQHVLGTRMVGDVLERAGWEVVQLGAATPARDLLDLAVSECPDLVALSTSTAGRLPGVQEILTGLTALAPRPVVAVGGPLYTAEVAGFARSLGADIVTSDLRTLLHSVQERFA